MKFKESDMYEPIRKLLTEQGFTVRGEVKGCDIAAVKDDILWIVEMKLSANITLIYQAMERQTATGWVFVAIPRPKNARDGNFRKLQKLVKKLQLGLITVALDTPAKYAEIIIFPVGKDDKKNKKTAALKKEIAGRSVDSTGGTTKTQINTAYRERCVRIACLLEVKGAASPKELVKLGCEKDASYLLRTNMLGWFEKVSKGMYGLSDVGIGYLEDNAAASLVVYYRMKADMLTSE
ncbi:MAG: DUF2161 family putative PD-(D/E)XK-type phosphodiesterase [Firmicutes bacterium]|nr:DUF2161 family putative PD-(D/E)XK-type phosphodiesterase [Bacillota bacterium]